MTDHRGHCHCGNLEMTFKTDKPIEVLAVRACACSFCRRHGARCLVDPEGSLTIRVRDPHRLTRYRFGLATADHLLCRTCGVYLAAVLEADGPSYAALNVNCLSDSTLGLTALEALDSDGESARDRIRRRKAEWTPLVAFLVGG